jgi:hypothetical protein
VDAQLSSISAAVVRSPNPSIVIRQSRKMIDLKISRMIS